MKLIKSKVKAAAFSLAIAITSFTGALAQVRPDIDVSVPRIRIRPPVAGPVLKIYEKMPGRLYFNADAETSLRLETNPYQAPRGNDPFTEATNAFRIQTSATMGYMLTNKTRVTVSYFMLKDQFNDFTPYHLDSFTQSVSAGLEHDFWQYKRWLLRGGVQARELFLPRNNESGDLIPSLTLIKSIGNSGWAFANASLDMSRPHFPLGDVDTLSQIYTVGTGYQIPYDSDKAWKKPLGGTSFNLSSTYSMGAAMNETPGSPANWHSIIITAEVAKPIARNVPVQLFVRAEPVFNFGTPEHDLFGMSGVNFRLFGGLRASLSKPSVAMVDLDAQISGSDQQEEQPAESQSMEIEEAPLEVGVIDEMTLEASDQALTENRP